MHTRLISISLLTLLFQFSLNCMELNTEYESLTKSMSLKNFNPNAALNTAASKNHVAAIEYIAIFYPREVSQEYDNAFPLSLAASHGSIEALLKLISKGAEVNAQDSYGNSALIWAMLPKGEYKLDEKIVFEIVDILLDFGADVNQKNKEGKTALMLACLHGHANVVKLLLERNADVHHCDNKGQSAMFLAFVNGHAETAYILAQHGAFLNFESNRSNGNLLNILAFRTNPETINLFIELMSEYEDPSELFDIALFKAIGSNKTENVKALVAHGANVHATNQKGYTTLHHAVISENLEMIKFFLDSKVAIDKKTPDGDTALCIAIKNNLIEVTALLLDHGAKVHVINSERLTPFAIASLRGFTDIIKMLKARASKKELGEALITAVSLNYSSMITTLATRDTVDARNAKLHTPLMTAAMRGNTDTAKQLLDIGANIELKDDQASTALSLACIHSKNQMIEFLITAGANCNTQDFLGRTPLHICVIKNNAEGLKILLKYHADKTKKNKKKETPLQTAVNFKRSALEELLK